MVEYVSTVWDPHTHRNITKLEQVQCHSARYVTGNHDYTSSISAMLRDLEWPTLEQRRHLSRLTMLYKIYNHLVNTDFTSQLTLRQSSTRGHASRLLTPTRSFLVLSGTGMHWRWIHYFFRLLMPSRTTSSLIRHLVTSVFNLLFYPPETWLTQPLCVCLLVWSRTVNGRRGRRRSNAS